MLKAFLKSSCTQIVSDEVDNKKRTRWKTASVPAAQATPNWLLGAKKAEKAEA